MRWRKVTILPSHSFAASTVTQCATVLVLDEYQEAFYTYHTAARGLVKYKNVIEPVKVTVHEEGKVIRITNLDAIATLDYLTLFWKIYELHEGFVFQLNSSCRLT